MAKDRTKNDRTTDLGVVRINNEAITTIASVAALEVNGVHRMGEGAFPKTICEILCMKSRPKGIRIQLNESEAKLTVSIIVEYGVDIPRIADEVQEMVKRAVERMTGMVLSEVDVIVEGVHHAQNGGKHETH